MTYDEASKIPEKWKGPAYICPQGHQMHPLRFAGCKEWFKDAHCKGGCGWIDQKLFTLDDKGRKRTEGRKMTETEDELNLEVEEVS